LVDEFVTPAQHYLILNYLSRRREGKNPRRPNPSAHYFNKAEEYTHNHTQIYVISLIHSNGRVKFVSVHGRKAYVGLEVRVHSYLIMAIDGSK